MHIQFIYLLCSIQLLENKDGENKWYLENRH